MGTAWNKGMSMEKQKEYSREINGRFDKGHHNVLEDNPNYKGGRTKITTGYILIKNPKHPFANKAGYVPEHRLVMEHKIGRYLKKEEVVHHINGKRDDNREENLELFNSKKEHMTNHNDKIKKDILRNSTTEELLQELDKRK